MTTMIDTSSLATATCHLCPPGGGTVVATYSGDGPASRAGDRARSEAWQTGVQHHDHYDPALDAFVVVRHQP
ncbi:hypothetical protein [Streptacidiphilus carbonis]|uniref:hypothetical protein n=1 Tax=Streptacidiphilus carbonis TaxID=105422 RepID=UPI0005A75642|nr:hypothetical protein [Streptacidiphilus carbonis]